MALSDMQWFRFYGEDWLADHKAAQLSAAERSCFVTLLCFVSASGNSSEGYVDPIQEDVLMMKSGIWPNTPQWKDTIGVLKKLQTLGFVTVSDSNVTKSDKKVTLNNWLKRQWITTDSAERMRAYRARKLGFKENSVTDDANKRSVSVSDSESNKIIVSRFDRFWSVYPKKVSKKKAEQTWKRLKPSEALTKKIVADVEKKAKTEDWKKERNKYVPHASTYLNQERWEDEDGGKKDSKYGNL